MKGVGLDLIRVTEGAAIAGSAWIGSGNKNAADLAATNAMRSRLNSISDFNAIVKIGEGKKDGAAGLFCGDRVGMDWYGVQDVSGYPISTPVGPMHEPWKLPSDAACYDLAVDPIDGTTQTVIGGSEAMSVLAVSGKDTMYTTDEFYMLKVAVGPEIAGRIYQGQTRHMFDLSMGIDVLCRRAAYLAEKPVDKLTVCILNRPRHEKYIAEMREIGVRIKLIQDCDVSGAIATCLPKSGVDMQFGIGGAPEAVITAAAMKCMDGLFYAQIWKDGECVGPVLTMEDLVRGPCCFAATGVTNGSMLQGVRFTGTHPVTHSVFMRSESGTIRWVQTEHGN